MRRLALVVSLLALVIAGLVGTGRQPFAGAQEGTPARDHSLVGAWLLTISSTGETAGAALPVNQTSLVTFFADGNVIVANAGQLPLLPPPRACSSPPGTATGSRPALIPPVPHSSSWCSIRQAASPAPTRGRWT